MSVIDYDEGWDDALLTLIQDILEEFGDKPNVVYRMNELIYMRMKNVR